MVRGFADATREYGALLDYMELAIIDGFLYSAVRPVGAPKTAKAPPPKFVFKLLVKLHPEIRRRVRRAEEVFRDRLWRKELEWWDTEVKPSLAKDGAALIGEDLSSSSKTALADHVKRVTEFARRTIYFHHRLNCCAILPLGDFLVHVTGWTGLASQDILVAMRGRSPLSAGATTELEALRVALVSDGDAMTTLMSDERGEYAAQSSRGVPPPSGRRCALTSRLSACVWLAATTWRIGMAVNGQIGSRHDPVRGDRGVQPDAGTEAEQAIASIRARVPEAHRAEFDAHHLEVCSQHDRLERHAEASGQVAQAD